ncbi:MAG TPA: hypothetical protein VNK95_12060, partial [Caldilineaceae bacterium]|nr:hypothetical protein [Caldilineaceae bacterium]
MGVMLFSSLLDGMLPAVLSRGNETPMPGPAATVAAAPAAETAIPAPSTPPPSPTPAESQGGLAVINSPERTPDPPATPSPVPPPAVPLESAWADAQAFFAERDWQSALDWLTIVRRIDDTYERAQVDSMLRTAYVGLVTQETVAGRYEEALRLLDEALKLLPEDPTLLSLRQATAQALSAEGEERSQAQRSLQAVYADYAAALMAAGEPCAAADQAAAALQLLAGAELVDQQAAYRRACQEQQDREALAALGGSIIYSAQQGDLYRVLRMPVGPDSPSTVLIEDAAQPSLRPDGRVIAYYSTRPDAQGLFGFDLMAGLRATDRGVRVTEYTEDARDAPASWNAAGNRLAFTSTRFGDGRYRVYLAWADGSGSESLDYGKDPAWHPSQDLLVYNGVGETGNQPGLWLRRPDGSAPVRLTDNGNDQRPAWSPDGRYVVFMSNGRDGNWELYRVDVTDFSIVRLTNHLAQDGLPTVSPDGRYVAFMSDRDNYWRIWYVSIDGGEARPLGRISGELPRWLEHSIQWVR